MAIGLVKALVAIGFAGTLAAASAAQAAVTGTVNPVNGELTLSGSLGYSYPSLNGTYVAAATGTTVYAASLTVGGQTRSYDVMRPNPARSGAPVLILLTALNTSPETMANLTEVTNFVATQGFWAVLPAPNNGQWHDDASYQPDDDVNFVSAVIDALVAQGVDATRIYAAGYSDGGFMTDRLACELSNKIAAFGIDAATLIKTAPTYCKPAVQRPKLVIMGTADNVVSYDGGTYTDSAAAAMSYWNGEQHCGGMVASTLPTIASDGTSVQLDNYTGCTAGQALKLYTVANGGHAWPGGLTQSVGKTSENLNATGLIWSFAAAFHR